MSNHEEIKNIADKENAQEDYNIQAKEVKGGFWLEEYINKQSGLVDKAFVKNSIGEVIEFVDTGGHWRRASHLMILSKPII